MKRSPECDDLVRRFEGYHRALPDGSCTAYPDVAHGWNVATIGFGTTFYQRIGAQKFGRRGVREGDVLTRGQAEDELDAELDSIESALTEQISAPVTQAQWDAMVSFCFNLGLAGASKQIERINAREYEECARAFDLYVKANGRVFQGLINRRNEEEALFRSEPFPDSNSPEIPDRSAGRPYEACPVPVPWKTPSGVLERGDEGESVYLLQCALIGLGYLAKPAEGELVGDVFNEHVEHAVKVFQKALVTGAGLADGIVGPMTRAALEEALTKARDPKPKPDASVATLRRIKDEWHQGRWAGLAVLNLGIGSETFRVASGQAGRQRFREAGDPNSMPGSMEPIPQGVYSFHGDPDFVGNNNVYSGSWGEGLGPVWHGLRNGQSMRRGAFGVHLDPVGAPGSAGCVVFSTVDDLRRYVEVWRKVRPKTLNVDWRIS